MKKGISLIVLVITIIVMTVLAGAIVLTISNSGIIEKANEAVEATNINQIKQLATLLWAEAFTDGARTQQDLEQAVLDGFEENGITADHYENYVMKVTGSGVDFKAWVTAKAEDFNTLCHDGEEGCYLDNHYNGTAEYVIVPSGISTWEMFYDTAVSVKGVKFIDGLQSVEKDCLTGSSVEIVYVPNSVVFIDMWAFSSCKNLTDIYFDGTIAEWNAIEKGEDWNTGSDNYTVRCTDGDIAKQ